MKQKMKHRNGIITMLAIIIISTFACKPDPLEYARPENLAGTIYQQLESMGTFNYYLQGLDQTTFKEPLLKGGSWTVFAPTDEAFEEFMQQEGFASFDAIPKDRVLHMIQNSIIIDAWNTTTLTYATFAFYEGNSFRKRTQYRDSIIDLNTDDYPETVLLRDEQNPLAPGVYKVDESFGRTKTAAYWLPNYINYPQNPSEFSDYDYMFDSEVPYEGDDMKIYEINVSQQNVVAENGIIYVLDKVNEPKSNLYQNLTLEEYGGKYSIFKSMIDRFAQLRLAGNALTEDRGIEEDLYLLEFRTGIQANLLPFNLADENFASLINSVDRTTTNAYGLTVPTNAALEAYLDGDSVLAQFYDSYDDMPLEVLGQFLAPNFFVNYYNICPSHIGQSYNVGLDLIDFKLEDVVDKNFCTNGLFTGVNKVYTNRNFSTVLGPLLLDPEYSIMLKAVQDLGIDNALVGTGIKFSIFGIKNDQFVDIPDPNSVTRRITVNTDLSTEFVTYIDVTGDGADRTYPDPNATKPSTADLNYVATTLKDIVLNQIVEEEVDFNSNNYYQTKSGEFIYASGGNSVAGGGNIANGTPAVVLADGIQNLDNGSFYEMDGPIRRPLDFTYKALVNAGSFSLFLDVMKEANTLVDIPGYDDKLVSLLNLQRTFTLLAPNDNAVSQAITDGVILDPNNLPSDALELAIARRDLNNFVRKHFLQTAITTNGETTGSFASFFFTRVIDFVPVYDEYTVEENNHGTSSLTIKNTQTSELITETGAITNLFSKRVIIHEIDNYLK